MAWQWHHFLLASNTTIDRGSCMPHRVKLKNIAYCPCQIVLNWTLWHKFKKWCKFSSHIKAKSRKKKSYKKRPACNKICIYYLLCFIVFKYAVFFYLLVYCCLTMVTECACLALHYQSLAWDMILCQFHPPLITSSVIVNHCNNALSSPFFQVTILCTRIYMQSLSLSIQLSFPVLNCLLFCCSSSSMQPE
jgi:hypothetical protein